MYFSVLFLACLTPAVMGVIVNLDSDPAVEQIQPLEVDLTPGQDLTELAESVLGATFYRNSRDAGSGSGDDGRRIGTTFTLTNTHRHYFALVHWTGYPSEVLFIVTMTRRSNPTDSALWRSTNYGRTFTNDTYKLNDSNAVIQWYYVSPKEGNLVFADVLQNKIFVTEDQGETFTSYELGFTPNRITFQGRSVPLVTEDDLPLHILGYDNRKQELHVSQNLGETWVLLSANVSRYAWRRLGEAYEANTAVYYERAINDEQAKLMVTQYPFEEAELFDYNIGPIDINSSVWAGEYILVQKSFNWTLQSEYQSPLWVSYLRQPFQQARFPLQSQEHHYAVLDASERQVFVAVYHTENQTNLYISEEQGVEYTLSLDYIVSPPIDDWEDRSPDFGIHVVEGITGIYLANRIRQVQSASTPTTLASSFISFDKGGQWQALRPPAVDRNNTPILCPAPTCALHLRMDADTALGYTSIASQDSAVGLLIAQGNVGANLERNNSLLRVYMSRDGGFTWQEVEEGHWSFKLVALGSIIVMVPKRATRDPIDSILWSCDEGATWNEYQFTDDPIRFVGMLVERGEKSRHVTIFGYYLGQRFAWLIIDLNFTDIVPNQCSADDYIEWTPTDGRPGSQCLLGSKMVFERRKSDVCCYVDPDYVRPITQSSCPCALEDYECDFGFEKVTLNSPCTAMNGTVWPPPPPENCREEGAYSYTSGYRKIAGDMCTEQDQSPYSAKVEPCPAIPPAGLSIKVETSKEEDTDIIVPEQELTFVLTQESGWTISTNYMWDFGDNMTSTTVGLKNSDMMTHAYDGIGTYTVKVKAWNRGGESEAVMVVKVGKEEEVDPPVIVQPISNNEKGSTNTGLIVGLIVTLAAVAAVVILFGVIMWWYRRRYNRLQVRYEHLQEGPLPMTMAQTEVKQDLGHKDDYKELIEDTDDQ